MKSSFAKRYKFILTNVRRLTLTSITKLRDEDSHQRSFKMIKCKNRKWWLLRFATKLLISTFGFTVLKYTIMLFMNYTSIHENQNPSTTQVQRNNLIAILSPSINPNSECNWVTHVNPQNKTSLFLARGNPLTSLE